VLQSDLSFHLFADSLHVHVVVLLIFIVDLINADKDLIIVIIKQLLDDDVDDQQQDSEADGVLVGVDAHVHHVCTLDLAIKVHFLAVNIKLIVFLPCLSMLL
jgi:hypothetical protein